MVKVKYVGNLAKWNGYVGFYDFLVGSYILIESFWLVLWFE